MTHKYTVGRTKVTEYRDGTLFLPITDEPEGVVILAEHRQAVALALLGKPTEAMIERMARELVLREEGEPSTLETLPAQDRDAYLSDARLLLDAALARGVGEAE